MSIKHESDPSTWNNFWSEGKFTPRENDGLLKAILRVMEDSVAGKYILEVGAGPGYDSIFLAGEGAKSFLVDFSPSSFNVSLRGARERGVMVIPLLADAATLPFEDNSFDLVFSQGLIEHYQPPDKLIEEQVRVLKSGGFILVDVPQLFSFQALKKRYLMSQNQWPFGWERNYTEGQLKDLLEKFGLEIVALYGRGTLVPFYFGIRTRLRGIFEKMGIKMEEEKKMRAELSSKNGRFQESWLGRHYLGDVGVIGRKV